MIPISGLPLESLIGIDVIDDCGLGTLPLCCVGHFALRLHQILIIINFSALNFKIQKWERIMQIALPSVWE